MSVQSISPLETGVFSVVPYPCFVESDSQLLEYLAKLISGRFNEVTLAEHRQSSGVGVQLPLVVKDGVSVLSQISERITIYTIHAAFLTDGWSIDILPQRIGEYDQPWAHGICMLASQIGSSKKLGEGHRVVGSRCGFVGVPRPK